MHEFVKVKEERVITLCACCSLEVFSFVTLKIYEVSITSNVWVPSKRVFHNTVFLDMNTVFSRYEIFSYRYQFKSITWPIPINLILLYVLELLYKLQFLHPGYSKDALIKPILVALA